MAQQQVGFTFVATDESARIPPRERQVIRRQCMRQRNKKPGSRRSKREAARTVLAEYSFDREEQDQDQEDSSGLERIPAGDQVASCSELQSTGIGRGRGRGRIPIFANQECIVPLSSLASDWALFEFPGELDIDSQKLMHQYYRRNPIRDLLYPFKYFGIQLNFHDDPSWCFQSLCSEPLYFHTILLLTSASNDLVLRQPLSSTTYRYIRHIIPILNARLSDRDAYKHDVILYAVSTLASIAILFGDYDTAKAHAAGLSEIIRLRGVLETVNSSPVIQFTIDRLNFSSSLVTKLWTPLYNSSIWKPPIFPQEVTYLHRSEGMLYADTLNVEPDLATAFHALQYTTILLNQHYHKKTEVDGMLIRQCLGFVHSSLIELEGRLRNDLSECLRLGMMTILATTFRLPDLHDRHYYCKDLTNNLQLSYAKVKTSSPDLHKTIGIWLIWMLLISTDNIDEVCVCINWKATMARTMSWSETRRLLKQVMWIDSFHDGLGKRVFEALMARIGPLHV